MKKDPILLLSLATMPAIPHLHLGFICILHTNTNNQSPSSLFNRNQHIRAQNLKANEDTLDVVTKTNTWLRNNISTKMYSFPSTSPHQLAIKKWKARLKYLTWLQDLF